MQAASRVEPGHTAAASTDLDNVQARDPNRKSSDVTTNEVLSGLRKGLITDHRRLRGGPSHVEGNGILVAEPFAQLDGADHPTGWP